LGDGGNGASWARKSRLAQGRVAIPNVPTPIGTLKAVFCRISAPIMARSFRAVFPHRHAHHGLTFSCHIPPSQLHDRTVISAKPLMRSLGTVISSCSPRAGPVEASCSGPRKRSREKALVCFANLTESKRNGYPTTQDSAKPIRRRPFWPVGPTRP